MKEVDVAIVGGGLAGLALAIQCAKDGFRVVVFEKDDYPRHKVCGEYISHESTPFLKELGVPLDAMELPQIDTFRLTSHHHVVAECALKPGGFGLSRFALDALLAEQATQAGAEVQTQTRVNHVEGDVETGFLLRTVHGDECRARVALGAWGRHGGLAAPLKSGASWVGFKYHLDEGPESRAIEIHAFAQGYAGVSRVEGDRWCMAYLCRSEALQACGNDVKRLEDECLSANPYLAERLQARKVVGPLATSRFHFGVTPPHALPTLGDGAGFIPPISGNGMSLALRGAKRTHGLVQGLLHGTMSPHTFARQHRTYANTYLNRRIAQGRMLQGVLTLQPDWLNAALIRSFSRMPFALRSMTTLATGNTI